MFLVTAAGALNAAVPAPIPAPPDPRPVLLVLGDSLSAGYGVPQGQGWVALLQKQVPKWRIVNASISGETTAGGVARLPSALKQHRPKLVLIALGGNDGLRGLPLPALQQNLSKLVQHSQASGAGVLMMQIEMPPNYGAAYAKGFAGSFEAVAKQHKIKLLPFFLNAIASDFSLFQEDGIHPTAAAQPLLLKQVLPALLPYF